VRRLLDRARHRARLALAPPASPRRPRCAVPEDLDFIRVDFGYEPDRTTFPSHNSLGRERTDPGLDGATAEKGNLKHRAVIRCQCGVHAQSLGRRSLVGHRCDSTA
jgi:hypothetical protein